MKTKKITGIFFTLSLGTFLSNTAFADITTTGTGDVINSSVSSNSENSSSATQSQNMTQTIQSGTVIDKQKASSEADEYLNAMSPILNNNSSGALGEYSSNAINNVEDNSSDAQNAYTSKQWNDSTNSWGTSSIKGANNSSEAGGCDPNVSKSLMGAQLQEIGGAKKLAAQTIVKPQSNSFSNLINSGCIPGFGGSIMFPSIDQLSNLPSKLSQQLCQAAQSMEQNYLNQYVSNPLSSLEANTNINLGSIGGYSLGSVPLGVQTSSSVTTGGNGGINFNSDAVQTMESLGNDTSNTMNSFRGLAGNGGSGGMSVGVVKNSFMSGIK